MEQLQMNFHKPNEKQAIERTKRPETRAVVEQLKEADQDFEWYPTTKEILRVIARDIKSEGDSHVSLLDIGAGNGQAFNILYDMINVVDEYKQNSFSMTKYAIEKSKILIDRMPDDVFIVGTDFAQNTLIDKKVDAIFCNPPYKEYAQWVEKIIKEANANIVYLVVPERWKDNKNIIQLIKKRTEKENGFTILGSFDFVDSEYRQARARVDIIKIKLSCSGYRNGLRVDPFDLWFDETFKIKADQSNYSSQYETNRTRAEKIKELVAGGNLLERLEELYQGDMEALLKTYKAIEQLDYEVLKELDVNLGGIKEAIKLKIEGLKNVYWQELFDNLDSITQRLTDGSKKSMLEKLNSNTNIDYSAENAYAIVIWAIKNANKYFDSQLVAVYKAITTPEAVKNYVSNKNIVSDNWRFCRDEHTHYILDYRIVCPRYNNFNESSYGDYDYPNGLSKGTHGFINDVCVIANNLGFPARETSLSFQWAPGKEKEIYCDHKGKKKLLMQVRAYKNGNLHFKLNQEFMTAFNIEASRLNGWVKSNEHMKKETGISEADIKKYSETNIKFKSIKLLS